MPIERMSVPGLNAIMANPNVVGPMVVEAPPRGDVLEPVVMQQGGLVGEAATLQNAGRGGDNMLVHMNPEEVGALNQLGQSGIGGLRSARMTINPQTGLPEMFDFTSLLPMIAGIAATAMGAGPLVAAAAAAGGSAGGDVIAGREVDLGRAFMAGVGTYATAGLAADVGSAGATLPGAEVTALSTLPTSAGGVAIDPSRALLTQAAESQAATAAQQAAAQAAETGVFATPPPGGIYEGIGTMAPPRPALAYGTDFSPMQTSTPPPVDMGIGLDYGGSYAGPTYADARGGWGTPMSPEVVDLARTDPGAFDAAVRAPGGATPYSEQEVARNIGRHTWQDDAGSNIWEGMKKISPEWEASKAGEIGLGEIAQPALIGAAGAAGSMPPPVWEPPPPRRSYAYDVSGMPDRSYEVENPPEGYVPGEDPEWEYIKDTTPSYDSASGYGLGSLGPAEPYTFLSKHGYRGRGDLPTVNAAGGWKETLTDWSTPSAGFGPPKPMREWTQENLPDWFTRLQDPLKMTPKIEKSLAKHLPDWSILGDSYRRSVDQEEGLKDQVVETPALTPDLEMMPITDEEEALRSQQNLPTVNAFLGSESGTVYPQSGGRSRQVPGGMMGGRLSSQIPWDKLTGLSENGRETPTHPLTREEEEERLRRISNYYQPSDWSPMQRDRYAFPAQAGTEGLVVEEAALQQLPPEEAVTTGIMDVAPPAAQDALAERMAVTPSPDQPQNPEERAIFDQALLALQGVLEPDAAEEAIDIFIETFGMDAYSELIALVENKMVEGGIVKPASGETTVAMGDVQGPDMIPGNIVDPMTGERTANLNVGENEYIEPAPSLARRAMAAGMPPTPENGAKVRGMEEDQLKAMYG